MAMTLFARFRPTDRAPRFRSGDRDHATDRQRLEGVRTAIHAAIASIDQEAAGLKRRLDEASDRAASIAGTDDDGYLQRDAAEEKLLSEAERQMMGASRRLDDLRMQRQFFDRALAQFGSFGEPAAAAAAPPVAVLP
jgi:hypothetical protein